MTKIDFGDVVVVYPLLFLQRYALEDYSRSAALYEQILGESKVHLGRFDTASDSD